MLTVAAASRATERRGRRLGIFGTSNCQVTQAPTELFRLIGPSTFHRGLAGSDTEYKEFADSLSNSADHVKERADTALASCLPRKGSIGCRMDVVSAISHWCDLAHQVVQMVRSFLPSQLPQTVPVRSEMAPQQSFSAE